VPRKNFSCPCSIQAGGSSESISDSDARSKGWCGASHGANSAPTIMIAATIAAPTATGLVRKLYQRSLSRKRRSAEGAATVT